MSDSIKIVTNQGWGSRIGGAIKGVVVGFGLTALSCSVLFWNEGRAVKTARALDEGQGLVVTVQAETVNTAQENKLILTNGEAKAPAPLQEPEFGFSTEAIGLRREVSHYQWVESKKSEPQKKVGGGTETVTTYSYSKDWVREPVNSDAFQQPDGHSNSTNVAYKNETYQAKDVQLGAFTLSENLVAGITRDEPLPLTSEMVSQIPESIRGSAQLDQGGLYYGMAPTSPSVGDVRVTFKKVPYQTVTVLGRQNGNRIGAYATSNGLTLESVRAGVLGKEQFFAAEKSDNETMTWILRALGFAFCFAGISLILKPLSVVADVIPFLGNLAEMGTSFVSFMLACMFSFSAMALGWFAYRPFLSMTLLGGVAAAVYALRQKRVKLANLKAMMSSPAAGVSEAGAGQKAA